MAISVDEAARKNDPVITNTHENNGLLQDTKARTSNHTQDDTPSINLHSNYHSSAHQPVQPLSPFPSPSPRSSSPVSSKGPESLEPLISPSIVASSNNSHSHSNAISPIQESVLNNHHGGASTRSRALSKSLPPANLLEVDMEKPVRPRKPSVSIPKGNGEVLKLSAADMEALTSAPESLPVTSPSRPLQQDHPALAASPVFERENMLGEANRLDPVYEKRTGIFHLSPTELSRQVTLPESDRQSNSETIFTPTNGVNRRPGFSSRSISAMPPSTTRMSSYQKSTPRPVSPRRRPAAHGPRPEPLDLSNPSKQHAQSSSVEPHSPVHIPLPPMSIPTYLQLELSSTRPSPLYIYRSANSEYPYESSKIKFERLLNFLLLPPQLEQVLYFGSLVCLDAWLHTFTILPLRFFKALFVLISWWCEVLIKETKFILGFIYHGAGRFWHRQREGRDRTDSSDRSRSTSRVRPPITTSSSYQNRPGKSVEMVNGNSARDTPKLEDERRYQSKQGWGRRHRRTKSMPSSLSSHHKADLLQGAVIICSCIILLKFDASRMYHSIRGQAAIKLYVIYNVLEVFDKLFSALGQDIFECLFSDETLERDLDGRSKILRPLGMFLLALIYNVVHSAALFYQVITLNVAVNSYSNALLTLLMSNQFVEIKSTVFKMFQKDNIFQMTCADIVERFQLWLMLVIIALRNIVEVGGISILSGEGAAADAVKQAASPLRSNSILPNSFTILPSWSGEVLSPFLLVLGSEMLVDWIKHAYISKFNRIQPAVYQKYLDVLAKDYYTNAFVNQNLMKRLGLPVIPLSCLFIRSSVQTYHMFLATHLPPPLPSTATALSVDAATSSPVTTAAFEHFDNIIRKALGRSTFGVSDPTATSRWYLPSADDAIAALTMIIFFLGAFLVLLACKLVLGMVLLKFARNRYRTMKKRENENYNMEGKRLGSWGMVEMEDEKRRHIFEDDPETLKRLKEKERLGKEKAAAGQDFSKISRYEMSAKRIW